MDDRDELIAKARKLSAAATPGPWNTPHYPDVVETAAGHRIAEACTGNYEDDATLIAESRTLLPALADLAESEGRRADEAADKLLKIAAAFNGWANGTDQGDLATLTALEMVGAALGDSLKGQQP